jgi:glycosyltransferase involved in cell wall biosynthesis
MVAINPRRHMLECAGSSGEGAGASASPSGRGDPLLPVTLSVVMPVYNEARTIAAVLERVVQATIALPTEIIVVDDASTDGTRQLLEHRPPGQIRLLVHAVNQGKGAAIRTGLAQATGDLVLIQDADLEYDPRDYPLLLEPLLEDHADVVFGNRFHGGPHRVLYFWHYAANRLLTLLTNLLTGLNVTDMEVGYKVFRRDVLQRITLTANRFGFEPEVTVKIAQLRCRVYEVPIRYYGRTYQDGKKITWRDGVAALFHLLRYRFFP